MPRNLQQTMALDLLLDDSVKLVSLIGSAGTGKTLLAIAAGHDQGAQRAGVYQKLLCARPIMPLGRDIGYLPGDKDEKLTAWMQPIFDNMATCCPTAWQRRGAATTRSHAPRRWPASSSGSSSSWRPGRSCSSR